MEEKFWAKYHVDAKKADSYHEPLLHKKDTGRWKAQMPAA